MVIVKYKSFSSNEEFVKWQLEKVRKISNVSPIIQSFDMKSRSENENSMIENSQTKAETGFGVFVTYLEEIEIKD